MKCTKEFDYAVMTMAYLACAGREQIVGRREISERLGLPDEFLAKVLGKLKRAGLVDSFQGARGGYRLGRGSDEISLGEIVTAIDGPVSFTRDLGRRTEEACEGFCLCEATEAVRRVEGMVAEALEGVKLEQMIAGNRDRAAAARRAGEA